MGLLCWGQSHGLPHTSLDDLLGAWIHGQSPSDQVVLKRLVAAGSVGCQRLARSAEVRELRGSKIRRNWISDHLIALNKYLFRSLSRSQFIIYTYYINISLSACAFPRCFISPLVARGMV